MFRKATLFSRLLLTAVLGLCCGLSAAVAQSGPYGNEWVQPGQPYYKIKVGQNGVHRLTAAWLTAAGVPLAGLNPRQLQLWRRGREQAIYVAGEADGTFDATDYIDFWGQPNDGRMEAELYKNPSEQITHLAPLYTDTAAYFLTVVPAPAQPLRMAALTSTPGILSPLTYQLNTSVLLPAAFYYRGPESETFLPWIDKFEGYLSRLFGITGRASEDFAVLMPGFRLATADTARLAPSLETGLANTTYAPITAEVVIIRGTGANTVVVRSVGTLNLPALGHGIFRSPLRFSDFETNGTLNFRVVVQNPNASSAIGFSYARVWSATNNGLNTRSRLLQTDSTLSGAAQYLLFNAPPRAAVAYDVTDGNRPIRITGQPSGSQWGVVVPTVGGGSRRVFVADDAAPLLPPTGKAVRFRALQPRPGAFMIVTGEVLLSDSLGNHPVRDYANYRASAAGGGHDTLVVTTNQLIDQFHYGDRSPAAIRHFARFMSSGSAPAGYLFLIGKGLEPETKSGNVVGNKARNRARFDRDIVPATGLPGADNIFTSDFQAGSYVPVVPTGRIVASTTAEVAAYLQKVQEHEVAPVASWRKEVLHLGGGRLLSEQRLFSNYLNGFAARVEDSPFFGGRVSSVLRGNSGQNVSNVNVSQEVNRGLAMMTFFGHSSTSVSDIDIGLVSDPLNGYRNAGRYPLLLMNGCTSGNVFQELRTFGEDWVLTPQRGAIAFLAHTGEGYANRLQTFSDAFYNAAFNDSTTYGKPLGRLYQRAVELATAQFSQQQMLNQPETQAQLSEMLLQGDPSVRLFSPDKPDFFIADSTVGLQPLPGDRVTARAPAFQVALRVRNYGKATKDSVRVQVRRTYRRNGTGANVVTTIQQVFAPVYYSDTLLVTIVNPDSALSQGPNTFEISVDWPNAVAELNEANNTATIQYNFPSGSVFALFPPEFAIVPTQTPGLFGQYDQALAQPRDYQFELADEPTFANGPLYQQQVVTAGRYPIWRPQLPNIAGRDSVVWYWRFRPVVIQPGEDSTWATSSFRRIAGSPGGWSQSHYGQFARDKKVSISQAVPSSVWSYAPTSLQLELRTQSGDSVRYTNAGATFALPPNGIVFNQSNRVRNDCGIQQPNMMLMVFDPRTFEPFNTVPRSNRLRCGQPGNNPTDLVVYQATGDTIGRAGNFGLAHMVGTGAAARVYVTARADSFATVINNIPTGYIVALVSMNRVPFEEMRQQRTALIQAIRSLGSTLIDTVRSGDPFLLVGRKGGAPGSAVERTADPTLPRWGQTITISNTQTSFVPAGTVYSTVIGPAQQWREIYHTITKPTATSSYQLNVIPVDAAGADGPRIPVTVGSNNAFSLSSVNAQQYPRMRLEMLSQDSINRQAPQLKQWLVTFEEAPEGIVRTDLVPASALDLTPQVETGSVRLAVPFQNIASQSFRDSLTTRFTILQLPSRSVVGLPVIVRTRPLKADSIATISAQLPVRLPSGDYVLQAAVNLDAAGAAIQPERYVFNNELEATFRVVNPNLAPLIDVAFDGQHILHGDIVAPSPVITISVRDEDRQQPIDPAQVTLVLTRPGQSPQQIPVNGTAGITVRPATSTRPLELTYEPGRLPDGTYRLQVQATDPAGNRAGADFYDSEFKVVNQTMISNFYPYPNPFSTSTRFLFTITGKVPQNLKIQIMTVTGRVVREITKEELGTDLRVGNNTSTTTWNGTDEYGDALANGVYLYRVVVQDDADEFKSYKTAGDSKAFHKNWGKLYILR